MRALLLIKQLTIIINSIWLREHKEIAQVHKTYIYTYISVARSGRMESALQWSAGKKLFGLLLQMQMQRDWATRLVCTSDCVSSTRREWPLAPAEPVGHSGNCCHHLLANRTRLVMRITDAAASCHLHMTSIISWRSRCGAIDSIARLSLSREQFACDFADKCRSIIISWRWQMSRHILTCAMRHTPSPIL